MKKLMMILAMVAFAGAMSAQTTTEKKPAEKTQSAEVKKSCSKSCCSGKTTATAQEGKAGCCAPAATATAEKGRKGRKARRATKGASTATAAKPAAAATKPKTVAATATPVKATSNKK